MGKKKELKVEVKMEGKLMYVPSLGTTVTEDKLLELQQNGK